MLLILVLFSFLIGSLPTGYLVGKAYGLDIRLHGSGNTGATNALRTLGKKAGVITLIGDIAKGIAAVHLSLTSEDLISLGALFGFAAILGHCYSPFLKFNGGKGVATSLGVFLATVPIGTIFSTIVFIIVVKITKYVSLGSILAAATLASYALMTENITFSNIKLVALLAASFLIIYRHKANISRLLSGNELKINSLK